MSLIFSFPSFSLKIVMIGSILWPYPKLHTVRKYQNLSKNSIYRKIRKLCQNQNKFWNFALNFYCLLKLKFEPKSQSSSLFSTFVLSSLGSIIINKQLSARCLKITEKVSFNIASYVYILSGQKLIKNAKNGPFWRVFENLKLAVKQCYQTGQFQ